MSEATTNQWLIEFLHRMMHEYIEYDARLYELLEEIPNRDLQEKARGFITSAGFLIAGLQHLAGVDLNDEDDDD